MVFGAYIKKRRTELGLTQEEVGGFGQAYIANIEAGRKHPAKRDTISKLAQALQIPERDVDWLWIYSLIDRDPREYFRLNTQPSRKPPVLYQVRESNTTRHDSDISIRIGETSEEVIAKLGQPTKRIQAPTKTKWIYETEGVHMVFVDNRVVDVEFK